MMDFLLEKLLNAILFPASLMLTSFFVLCRSRAQYYAHVSVSVNVRESTRVGYYDAVTLVREKKLESTEVR